MQLDSAYSEPWQTSMRRFAKIGFSPLTIFGKRSILVLSQGSENAYAFRSSRLDWIRSLNWHSTNMLLVKIS